MFVMIRRVPLTVLLVACCASGCAGSDESGRESVAVATTSADRAETSIVTVTSTAPDTVVTTAADASPIATEPPVTSAATPASETATSATVASSGCAAPSPAATTLAVASGGATRSTLLALPADLSVPAPLVVDLHGLGAEAAQQAAYSGLAVRGPAAGVVVATPESASGPFWVLPVRPGTADVVFVRDLIVAIGAQYCIDTARVVVTGISNGGGLAAGIGCELADLVTAVVPVAGVNIAATCDGASSIVAFHGVDDPIIPYAGGAPFAGMDRTDSTRTSAGGRALASMSLPTVEESVSAWAAVNGCADPVDTPIGADVVHRVWNGCRPGRVVELYSVLGGGHTWPGGTPVPTLGGTTATVDATQVVLELAASLARD